MTLLASWAPSTPTPDSKTLLRPTIHLKVMLLIGAALCLLLGITGYFALQNEKRFLIVEAEKRSRNLRRSLEALTRLALTTGEEGPLRQYLAQLTGEDDDILIVRIFDADDRMLLTTPPPKQGSEVPPEDIQTSPIYVDNQFAGRVEIAFNAESLRAILQRITVLILASVVDSLLFLGLLLHLALKYFVTRPLKSFIEGSNKIASGDFGATIHTGTRDELADLSQAFNHMSTKLQLYRTQIESNRQELEERVRERTAELASQMERARELSLQIQHADRLSSLGTLAAGVAHELNNPIGNISTFVQLLQERVEVPPEILTRCLSNLSTETARAGQIVAKLLEFARHEPRDRETTPVRPLVGRALALLSSSFKEGRVVPEVRIDDDIPDLQVDSAAILQVLVNIMTNALHAMPDGGTLSIRGTREGSEVRLSLSDTGIGIDEEVQGRVFDPFFTTKEVGKGTGLGLSVSYGIVRENGGRISVDSRRGEGATFHIALPAAGNEEQGPGYGHEGGRLTTTLGDGMI